jgi:hypothetical protein
LEWELEVLNLLAVLADLGEVGEADVLHEGRGSAEFLGEQGQGEVVGPRYVVGEVVLEEVPRILTVN